jgi:predicted dehydrogenase
MNLNQQSFGREWALHKTFIDNMPPLVDCGVHYVDVMCQMTRARPKLVQGIAARVSEEVDADKHNYGMLPVVFDDDSVGWYEVGWGRCEPAPSRQGRWPRSCVSIDKDIPANPQTCPNTWWWTTSSCTPARPADGYAARRTRSSRSPTTDHSSCARGSGGAVRGHNRDTDLTDHGPTQ